MLHNVVVLIHVHELTASINLHQLQDQITPTPHL